MEKRPLSSRAMGAALRDHFCALFDHRYLPRGLAMWESLRRHRASAELSILCLTPSCEAILAGLHLPGVHLVPLSAIENAFPALGTARGNRSLVEYYFTIKPALTLYLLDQGQDRERISYLDSDLFFFADPGPVLDEMGPASIGIIEHRFPDALKTLEMYGRFNAGWLSFRNDENARACLNRWLGQCLEWCARQVEPSRFADQKYLDEWPRSASALKVLEHRGANVAPWNLDRFPLEERHGSLFVGGDPLLFFHAHGFEPESPGLPATLNLQRYGVAETPCLRKHIFDPYATALASATARVAPELVGALLREGIRGANNAVGERLLSRLIASSHKSG